MKAVFKSIGSVVAAIIYIFLAITGFLIARLSPGKSGPTGEKQ